ncbi:Fc receptor-like B [Perca fluviatilis]|uniref:Fc receptor-like B n=1 Tax=Perca fluviatilis TaxID=8168 RepID=UPI0019625638|nr:Fc receptor-like B [Perca fluviatilis]
MEVTAFRIRLLINVLFLLCALDQKVYSVFLRVDPNRLQFFEYEPVTLHCEGVKGEVFSCGTHSRLGTKQVPCNIKSVYLEDSGEYWCEAEGGERSNSVDITVTEHSVIMVSPALPVMEGEAVILGCRNKTASFNLRADFYKDGRLISSSSTGEMTLHSVSKSDKGLYKCNISGAGESPESWLAVRAVRPETRPSSDDWFLMLRTVLPLVMMAPLLLLLGLLHCGRLGGSRSRCALTDSRTEDSQKSTEDALQATVLF